MPPGKVRPHFPGAWHRARSRTRKHPGVSAKVFDPSGNVKPFIRIYVGPDDIGSLSGLDTQVGERDEIAIIPAIAGGSDAR